MPLRRRPRRRPFAGGSFLGNAEQRLISGRNIPPKLNERLARLLPAEHVSNELLNWEALCFRSTLWALRGCYRKIRVGGNLFVAIIVSAGTHNYITEDTLYVKSQRNRIIKTTLDRQCLNDKMLNFIGLHIFENRIVQNANV